MEPIILPDNVTVSAKNGFVSEDGEFQIPRPSGATMVYSPRSMSLNGIFGDKYIIGFT